MTLIQIAISLLLTELDAAKVGGAAPAIIANIQAAIDALMKVHGTDVTYEQLEGLRVKPTWPTVPATD
jgi:hypothetical protein